MRATPWAGAFPNLNTGGARLLSTREPVGPSPSNRTPVQDTGVVADPLLSTGVLEKPLEKKSGRNYGPPGTKKLIYFIDDMNMPEVDKYGTVAPHTLIRQHMDHGHW